MTIDQLVTMARRIHDAEGIDLGSASTRTQRNAFWARVVGCAHHGHPIYNAGPDPQWHLKNGGGGRPQSDDVAVSMPSKTFWDCIPGAGADGYSFHASGPEHLDSPPQVIYAPPVPHGAVFPSPPPQPAPPSSVPAYPGDAVFDAVGVVLFADYASAGQAPNPQMGRWFGRTIYDFLSGGLTLEASIAKHRAEWRSLLGLPPL
jgi:hypothetical protein